MGILFWLAVLPSIILASRVLAYDRIEKEPPKLLLKLFCMGMLTCIPAAIIEAVGSGIIASVVTSERLLSMLMYLFLVPMAEEGVKYLALRRTHDNPNFNYTFDGIVYAVMVGLGFATLENILYVLEYQTIETAIMRGILSVPLHCTCGVFMGYFYGVARGQEARGSEEEAARARTLALAVPCIIHGLYDYSLDTETLLASLLGLAFTVIVFWLAAKQVKIASINDAPIMVSLAELNAPLPEDGASDWKSKGTPPPPFNKEG
ncbi:MAG: PrsW family intramembrane metalloprotease [Atopobiaceae bacterium]|nr:PrsW family intramembrane metalloprotease [Atopobiaceae bacterium]